MDALPPVPTEGRVYGAERRIRLSDADASGRLRLDAVARYLQDVASDDVDETGWGAPDHLWVVRSYRVEVVVPFGRDRHVELRTWCSGLAPVAAGRRTSVTGDAGGRIEVDSAWIHLDRDARPARLDESFGVYGAAAGGRRVSTRLTLPDPPAGAAGRPWQLRPTDVDRMGHVNNAVHWEAVEELFPRGALDPAAPLRAVLEYRGPLDAGDAVELIEHRHDGGASLALRVAGDVRAVARVDQPAVVG